MVRPVLVSQGFVVKGPASVRFVEERAEIATAIAAIVAEHNASIDHTTPDTDDLYIDADDVYVLEVFSKGWRGRVYADGVRANMSIAEWDARFALMMDP